MDFVLEPKFVLFLGLSTLTYLLCYLLVWQTWKWPLSGKSRGIYRRLEKCQEIIGDNLGRENFFGVNFVFGATATLIIALV